LVFRWDPELHLVFKYKRGYTDTNMTVVCHYDLLLLKYQNEMLLPGRCITLPAITRSLRPPIFFSTHSSSSPSTLHPHPHLQLVNLPPMPHIQHTLHNPYSYLIYMSNHSHSLQSNTFVNDINLDILSYPH